MKIDLLLLSEKRREVYKFYKLDFLEDGTPVKNTDHGFIFHPILAAYLINDFLTIYEKDRSKNQALEYAVHIAEQSLVKAEVFEDSLVFWYNPEEKLSLIPTKFYSGLTQSWYVKAIARLSNTVVADSLSNLDFSFHVYMLKFFNSLKIPLEMGGVLLKKDFGWIVEEYPLDPPLYTLNGWLTVLRILIDSEKYMKKIEGVKEFIENNLSAVKYLLPKYDAEFCLNTRYQLTGFSRFRLIFPDKITFDISEFSIHIPNEGTYEGSLSKGKLNRWNNYVERVDGRLLQFNIVMSLLPFPESNQFKASINVNTSCKVRCFIADGDYNPSLSAMPTIGWRELESIELEEGNNNIKIDLLYDEKNMFAYPTNFNKDIHLGKGMLYNAYHFVHITDLAVIYKFSKETIFLDYCNKWLGYVDQWQTLPFMSSGKYSPEPYLGDEYNKRLEKLLGSEKEDNNESM